MKRFSRTKTDELVSTLASITFDATGLKTDLAKLHSKMPECVREYYSECSKSTQKSVEKYISTYMVLTIHQSMMESMIDLPVDKERVDFLKKSFDFCVPVLDELGVL